MTNMAAEKDHEIRYVTEPIAEGVRFILPRYPGGTKGGCCAILFGMMFSGFAVVWMLSVSGVATPFLESVIDPLFESFEDPEMREQFRQMEEEADREHQPDAAKTSGDETPDLETPGPETPAAEKPAPSQPLPSTPGQTPPPSGGFDIGSLFLALFGLPFLLAGLAPITMGLLLILGHSEVEITPDYITYSQRAGPLRRRQKRHSMNLTRLEIGRGPDRRGQAEEAIQRGKPKPTFSINAIHAEFKDESPMAMCAGYPLVLLRALAKDIESEHQRITSVRSVAIEEPHVEGEHASLANEMYVPESVPAQPTSSAVHIDRLPSGITLRIPPAGFTKAAMGPFLFGVIWCGAISLFTFGMFAIGVPLAMYLFMSIFWIVGLAMLLLGVSLMRRQAVIDVVHDTLVVTQQGIFGRKQNEWRAEDLLDVRVDHSGTSINDRPILNLQFVPREGAIVGLGTGRDEEELYWMAAEIRTALRLKKRE